MTRKTCMTIAAVALLCGGATGDDGVRVNTVGGVGAIALVPGSVA